MPPVPPAGANTSADYPAPRPPLLHPPHRDAPKAGQPDFSHLIQKIKSFGADWVYFADEGPATAPFVTQLKQQGLTIGQNIQFLGTDGEEDPPIIARSAGAYEGAYATNIPPHPAGGA